MAKELEMLYKQNVQTIKMIKENTIEQEGILKLEKEMKFNCRRE